MNIKLSRKPKYKEILTYLIEQINNGKDMEKLPTEIELSHKFKASHITVRKALDELEKQSLIVRLPGKGTFIRKIKKDIKVLQYLVILNPKGSPTTGFYIPSIMSGIFSSETKNEFHIKTYNYLYNFEELKEICRNYDINGIIWLMPHLNHIPIIKELEKLLYPVIAVNRVEPGINYVSTDHENSTEKIIEFLIKKGHKKIGFVGFLKELSYIMQRYKGFLNAHKKFRIDFDEKGIVKMKLASFNPLEFDFSNFKNDFKKMLEDYKPTAIFVSGGGLNDYVMEVIKEKRIDLTKDLEIATFDEFPEKYKEKKYVHEVIQPLFELGKYSGEQLEKLITGEVKNVAITLPSFLNLKRKEVNKNEKKGVYSY